MGSFRASAWATPSEPDVAAMIDPAMIGTSQSKMMIIWKNPRPVVGMRNRKNWFPSPKYASVKTPTAIGMP